MINYRLTIITPPSIEPVTLAEAKAHLRIDGTDDDTYITTLITVARQSAEEYCNRSFINTTWKMFFDRWPCGDYDNYQDGYFEMPSTEVYRAMPLTLPKGRLQSVTHIKTYDDAGTATTLAASNYFTGAYSDASGQITITNGGTIPSPTRVRDGIEVQYVAGYGSLAADVPAAIKQGILEQIAGLYENRGDCSGGAVGGRAGVLLSQYRIIRL